MKWDEEKLENYIKLMKWQENKNKFFFKKGKTERNLSENAAFQMLSVAFIKNIERQDSV